MSFRDRLHQPSESEDGSIDPDINRRRPLAAVRIVAAYVQGCRVFRNLRIRIMFSPIVVITGGYVVHSILSPCVRVETSAVVESSVLFDGVQVGPGVEPHQCIMNENIHIPASESIGLNPVRDAERFHVSERDVVVVPRGYEFPEMEFATNSMRSVEPIHRS